MLSETSVREKPRDSTLKVYKNDALQVVVPAGCAVVHFTLPQYDLLGEYNLAAWSFTPQRAGYYVIGVQLRLDIINPLGVQNSGEIRILGVADYADAYHSYSGVTGVIHIQAAFMTYLTPADVITVQYLNGGAVNHHILPSRATNFWAKRLR